MSLMLALEKLLDGPVTHGGARNLHGTEGCEFPAPIGPDPATVHTV